MRVVGTIASRTTTGIAVAAVLIVGGVSPAVAGSAVLPTVSTVIGAPIPDTPTVDVTGLVAPVTWSVTPDLPAGLALDVGTSSTTGTGVLSGTPSTASPIATYTITVTDSTPSSPVVRSVDVPIVVDGELAAPGSVTATVGQALSGVPSISVTGLTAPLVFSAPAAPGWLHIAAGGALSGIPDALMAPTQLPVTAVDSHGAAAHGMLTLSVVGSLSPATQSIVGVSGAPLGSASSGFPAAPNVSYTVTPDVTTATGLAFDASSGVISGTPTHPLAPTPFVVQQVSTQDGVVHAQAVLSITVEGVLGTTPAAVSGTVGTAVTPTTPYPTNAALSAGLTAPLTYSTMPPLPGASSPGDLSISSTTGVVSGRPSSAVQSAVYDVVVTDAAGARARGPMSVSINGSILPAVQSVNGTVGASFLSRSVSAVGMASPVQYAIAPAPPAGLLFNATTGALSGVPRAVLPAATFTITATDASGATGAARLTVTIGKAVLLAPVIGSVVGGPASGSIVVTFTPPRLAPVGQTYTVEVYDALGADRVTSVDSRTSPVTVTGLTPGEDYQVIVVANATADYDRVQSLPKLGTASLDTTANLPTSTAVNAAAVVTSTGKPTVSVLKRAGITLASPAQAARARRLVVTRLAARAAAKAPVVKMKRGAFVRLLVTMPPVAGNVLVSIRAGGSWLGLGSVRPNSRHRLRVPALSIATAGRYSLLLADSTGAPWYITLAVGP